MRKIHPQNCTCNKLYDEVQKETKVVRKEGKPCPFCRKPMFVEWTLTRDGK